MAERNTPSGAATLSGPGTLVGWSGNGSVVEMEAVVPVRRAFPLLVLVVLENGVEQRVHDLAELLDLGPEALYLAGQFGFGASHRVPSFCDTHGTFISLCIKNAIAILGIGSCRWFSKTVPVRWRERARSAVV